MMRIGLCLLLLACGAGQQTAGPEGSKGDAVSAKGRSVEKPVVFVNGAAIGEDDLLQAASRARPADGKVHTKEEREALITELITDEVLFQEALKAQLYHDPKVRKILTNLLLRQEVYANVSNSDFSEEELVAYYDAHKEEFVVPERVQVKRILVPIGPDEAAAKKTADEIHAILKKDPNQFGELVALHSKGPFQRRGGDLGFLSAEGKPGVEPEVVEAAFKLPLEGISEPFKAGGSFHIISVVNKRERTERSFAQMKGSVLRMVKQERFESLRNGFIERTLATYEVKRDEKALEAADLGRRSVPRMTPVSHGAPEGADEEAGGEDDGHGHDH